jgi:dTDP-4-amino-4,6-dideoxygalactose transaminase
MNNLRAYIAYLQLKNIDKIIKMKKHIAKVFRDVLGQYPKLFKQFYNPNAVYVRYPFAPTCNTLSREFLIKWFSKKTSLEIGIWFNDVIHPKGSLKYCYNLGSCIVGERFSQTLLNLPMNLRIYKVLNKVREELNTAIKELQNFVQVKN